MPITDTAPYGSTPAITKVMETYRETGLGGAPITIDLVTRMSMGVEVARRAVLSLRLLELIDDDGNPTANFVAFKQAPASDYRQVFANLLYEVYAPIFAVLGKDPSTKTTTEVEDAFRSFKQDSLRKRMVTCFTGLCRYAGIIEETSAGGGVAKPRVRPAAARPRSPRKREDDLPAPPPLPPLTASGMTASATLHSGGSVTLTVSVDLVDLTVADREFVFDLIDRVKGYGDRPALTSGSQTDGGAD